MRKPLTLILLCFCFLPHSQAQFGKLSNYLTEFVLKGKAQKELELGIEKYAEQNFEGAFVHFDEVVNKKPKANIGWRLRGLTQLSLEKPQDAISDFDKALEIESWDYHSLYLRAMALIGLGKHNFAAKDLYRCRSLASNWENSYYGLGLYHTQVGTLDSALFHLDKAMEINPDFQEALLLRGAIYFQNEIHDLAYDNFGRAIQLGEVEPAVLLNYGIVACRLGELTEGSRITQILSDRFPGHPNVLFLQGNLEFEKGNFEKGIALLQQSIAALHVLRKKGIMKFSGTIQVRSKVDTLPAGYSAEMACTYLIKAAQLGHAQAAKYKTSICK